VDDADAVEMAIWFHDVVYAPGAADNEHRSAAFFERAAGASLEPGFIRTVSRLILATTHRGAPRGRDEELIRDIDLAGIGSPWQRFLSDSRSLRAEQAEATDALFYAGKLRFLKALRDRRTIYFTEFFHARFETVARRNIERYIARLGTAGRG
jgi:predicted metal-dependent HD superfamily phosphohydrolase